MLTEEGIQAIRKASVVYGAKRALEIAQDYISCEAKPIKDYKSLHLLPADAVILSTGDPMFSGLGNLQVKRTQLFREFPRCRWLVLVQKLI